MSPFSVKELFFVFFVTGCLVTFSLLSWAYSSVFSIPLPKKICIEVKGAVKNPGKFYVYPGTFLQKVVRKAKPVKDAEFLFSKEELVCKSSTIYVPFRKNICVYVSGALENPGKFELPLGSNMEALLPFLKLKKGALVKKGQRKKILKQEEEIQISLE